MNKCTVSVLKTGLAGMAAAAVLFGAWPQAEAAVITAPPEAKQHQELQGQRPPGEYDVRFNDGLVVSGVLAAKQGQRNAVGLTYRVEDGRQLRLADLFLPGDAYAKRINALIMARPESGRYCFQGIREEQTFYLTPQGIVVYFRPCEIAPARMGQVEFLISFAQVQELLKPEYRNL